ncbi:hypothetical protein [Candidatus Kuenenia stuttgartiensis]|jgi:hypothetical protein|uniref:Uncharacterized protein n=1 Tax=Kuenenia stuttgartiensis TaxID=174633 RepID=A0A2C9CCE0_KUEST|nr:hypothetical protein [Candidatus Kuenenia stuttgartiensis]SOH03350.1 hypothetical protein KSMBR1_0839 [Candidatus Kuenenia stuttgartiensis]
MNTFSTFFKALLNNSNISLSRDLYIDEIKYIISKINEYFYTNYKGIGDTNILDVEFEYFSEFHKFWEKYHKQILNPQIDDSQCSNVAEVLHDIFTKYGRTLFYELYSTCSLTPEKICKIRYFSANQDFRGSRKFEDLFKRYKDDPSIFDTNNINQNPEDFLRNIGITSLSQNDKRVKYAITASKLLIDNRIEPYELLSFCQNDIEKVRTLLINNRGSGFGNKKTDMFLRDMVVLGVWKNPKNFDKIDVASDINTVKVALRSRILKTDIVLISSFLDVFCYQYTLIDNMNALAWRRVWEIWNNKYPKECIASPSLIDYFIYRIIGKEFCKESLCIFKCETENHTFKWHSGRNKTCQICFRNKVKSKAHVINKVLPCTDNEGYLVIENSGFVSGNNSLLPNLKECPFEIVCKPKTDIFKKLNPPTSISIFGQTGWDKARTRVGEGGGGIMS